MLESRRAKNQQCAVQSRIRSTVERTVGQYYMGTIDYVTCISKLKGLTERAEPLSRKLINAAISNVEQAELPRQALGHASHVPVSHEQDSLEEEQVGEDQHDAACGSGREDSGYCGDSSRGGSPGDLSSGILDYYVLEADCHSCDLDFSNEGGPVAPLRNGQDGVQEKQSVQGNNNLDEELFYLSPGDRCDSLSPFPWSLPSEARQSPCLFGEVDPQHDAESSEPSSHNPVMMMGGI